MRTALAGGFLTIGFSAALLVAPVVQASAQTYPDRPIRLIVPFAPGGTTDSLSRLVAARLSDRLGKTMVVENRPGAGSQIGLEAAMRAAPDGYTLVMGTLDGLAALPAMKKKAPFNPVTDFKAVALVATGPLVYAVGAKFPPNTMAELVSYAKQHKGEVRYGSPGPGSVLHLGIEWLQSMTGTQMIHVPFRGGAPMMQALVAGTVDLVLTSADFTKNFAESGKLKALAQADTKRHPLLPNVPTTADVGFPDLQVVSWFGILGPANLPQPIADRLAKEIGAILSDPELLKRMEMVGTAPAYKPGETFTRFIGDEAKKWDRIVKDAKIPLQD